MRFIQQPKKEYFFFKKKKHILYLQKQANYEYHPSTQQIEKSVKES
jgi:hypothetical protein